MQEENFTIEEAYAYYIHRIDRLFGIHFQSMVKSHGIDVSIEQWFILTKLYKNAGASQIELADKIFKDKANITRMVDGLEKKDLVIRKDDENDRRKFRIYLTDRGKELTKRLIKIAIEERKNIYKTLSKNDLKKFKEIIETLEKNILSSKYYDSVINS
ncbi:MAG: MarR family transcriptional regulator [Leptospiraceae bacterium]|nr:MarR family transcriptional regulator [Leptospiraceae bacterium]